MKGITVVKLCMHKSIQLLFLQEALVNLTLVEEKEEFQSQMVWLLVQQWELWSQMV